MKYLLLGLLVNAALSSGSKDRKKEISEYCNICADHTLCKYQSIGKSCKGSSDGGINEVEKELILQYHNNIRRRIAKGLEGRGVNGSQPSASNMMKLEWDTNLQKTAQRWADQCKFEHDSCRNDKRWKVGQNIYMNFRVPIIKTVNWTAALTSWYDEVDIFNPEIVNSYEFDVQTGHFTQMIWHDTSYIGCGRRTYGPNKVYVCNYGPTGNWLNENIYSIGEPCSECPFGTYCSNGLCEIGPDYQSPVFEDYEEDENITLPEILQPPEENATSVYDAEDIASSTELPELPIQLNLIDNLLIPDDASIREEIAELKERIKKLAEKIAVFNAQNH